MMQVTTKKEFHACESQSNTSKINSADNWRFECEHSYF